eukprot:4299699-Pyramimonas_sp.AAC.1
MGPWGEEEDTERGVEDEKETEKAVGSKEAEAATTTTTTTTAAAAAAAAVAAAAAISGRPQEAPVEASADRVPCFKRRKTSADAVNSPPRPANSPPRPAKSPVGGAGAAVVAAPCRSNRATGGSAAVGCARAAASDS